MKNLVLALMMLLVLGAGFFLGSKYNLNDGQLNILELTNGTSDNLDSPRLVKEDLNKSKGQYKIVNNQKSDFKEGLKSEAENDNATNKNMDEVSNNEPDIDLNDENGQEIKNNQSENKT
jgi:hypothetical protein